MTLPESREDGLLQLPNRVLPSWTELPVLDLLGVLTTEMELVRLGMERRVDMSTCEPTTARGTSFDARDLLCGGYYERDGVE